MDRDNGFAIIIFGRKTIHRSLTSDSAQNKNILTYPEAQMNLILVPILKFVLFHRNRTTGVVQKMYIGK